MHWRHLAGFPPTGVVWFEAPSVTFRHESRVSVLKLDMLELPKVARLGFAENGNTVR